MSISNFDFADLIKKAEISFAEIENIHELEELRIKFLGDKSEIKQKQKELSGALPEDKPKLGKIINNTKNEIDNFFKQAKNKIETKLLNQKLNTEKIDISLPGINAFPKANLHPLSLITADIIEIFKRLGFSLLDGPEIETEYYNFTALNTPENHPARDEQDTFYTNIAPHILLRSQTSPIQIRALEKYGLPLRIMSAGRVFRNEETNARKLPFFHQFEILCVEKNINFSHLKWTLQTFLNQLFGQNTEIRLRPDFFPFTEPSAEVDAQCPFCKGKGCSTCGNRGWLELLGCGLVDPNVLEMAGINSKEYSGFAAGLGLERFAMLKYGLSDIRELYAGDLRFLSQFNI